MSEITTIRVRPSHPSNPSCPVRNYDGCYPADMPCCTCPWKIDPATERLTSRGDVAALLDLIEGTTGNVLEVGCARGLTTRDVALNFPERTVWAIDWSGPINPHQASERPSVLCEFAKDLPNVNFLNLNSREAFWKEVFWDGNQIGFAFIDGDHSFEGVKADTEAVLRAFPKVRIAWHDFYPHCPDWCGVTDYVISAFGDSYNAVPGTWLAWRDFLGSNEGKA